MPNEDETVRWIRFGGEDGELVIGGGDEAELGDRIELCEQAAAAARESGDRREEGAAVLNLGIACFSQGKLDCAIEHYERALAISRELSDRQEEASVLRHLGTVYELQGRMTDAIEHCEQAIVIYREIGDRLGEAKQLGSLGVLFMSLGTPAQMRRAIEPLQQALSISREIGDRGQEALTLGNLGAVYISLGRVRDALQCHEQALSISRETGDRNREVDVLRNLATDYLCAGQGEHAIESCQQALSISYEISDRDKEAMILLNMGAIYSHLEQEEKAVEATQAAVRILDETGGPGADKAQEQLDHLRGAKSNKRASVIGALLVIILIAAVVGVRALLSSLSAKSSQFNADFWSTASALQTPANLVIFEQERYVSAEELYRNAPIDLTKQEDWTQWENEYVGKYVREEGRLAMVTAHPQEGKLFLVFTISGEEGTIENNTAQVALLVEDVHQVELGEKEGSFLIDGSKWVYAGEDYAFEGRVSGFSLFDTELALVGYRDLIVVKGRMSDIEEK